MFVNRLLWLHLKRRCCAYSQSTALKNDALEKIVYNSVLQSKKNTQFWRKLGEKNKIQKQVEIKSYVEPVSLQYLDEYVQQKETPPNPRIVEGSEDRPHVLPYSIVSKVSPIANEEEEIKENEDNEINYDCKFECNRIYFYF